MKLIRLAVPVVLLVVLTQTATRDDVLRLTAHVMRGMAEVLELAVR